MSQEPEKPSDTASELVKQVHNTLRKSIHESVGAANKMLAALETTSSELSQPLAKGLSAVEQQGSSAATTAWHVYERRHEFGPYLVLGSAFTVGGITALRRGRFPGVFSGAVTAGMAYVAIYEPIPLEDIPDLLFGKKS